MAYIFIEDILSKLLKSKNIDDIGTFITDKGISNEFTEELKKRNIEVVIV